MHWRSGYIPRDNEVADAEGLMAGFGDALGAAWGEIDQNDLAAAKLLSSRLRKPLTGVGISICNNSTPGSLALDTLTTNQSLPLPIRQDTGDSDMGELNQEWVFVEKTLGNPLTITITPLTSAVWRIMAQGSYRANNTSTTPRVVRLDARILLDGTPLDGVVTVSSQVDNGWMSWFIEDDVDVDAGTHTIRMQVRDRSEDKTVQGVLHDASLMAAGDVR